MRRSTSIVFTTTLLAVTLLAAGCGADRADAERPFQADWWSLRPRVEVVVVADGFPEGRLGLAAGPDGSLYLATGTGSSVVRIDPTTGTVSAVAVGLPAAASPIGGVVDLAFVDDQLFALTSMVESETSSRMAAGVHLIDDGGHRVFADIGAFARDNPPSMEIGVAAGVPAGLAAHDGELLVADGHHNRVLRVAGDGTSSEVVAFGNVVPTGLVSDGETVHLTLAGPVPHTADDGRVVSFSLAAPEPATTASGARLAVDITEHEGRLLVLAQGVHDGRAVGSAAEPFTGELLRVAPDGTMTSLVTELDRPTSIVSLDGEVYVASLSGAVWRLSGL